MIAQPASSPVVQPVETDTPPETTIDQIVAILQRLTPEQQQQVLDFVEFLAQKTSPQPPEPTIWETIRETMADVPDEEWEKMPTDGSYQHDHYLYGTPKREL